MTFAGIVLLLALTHCINIYIQDFKKASRLTHSQNLMQQEVMKASAKCSISRMRYLIDLGANVNPNDTEEETPLYVALSKGHIELANFLIDNGANIQCIVTLKDKHPQKSAISQFIENLFLHYGQKIATDGRVLNLTNPIYLSPYYPKSCHTLASRVIEILKDRFPNELLLEILQYAVNKDKEFFIRKILSIP